MAPDRRRGKTVTVIGWLFIVSGLCVLVDVIISARHDFYKIDFGLLALPIGLGILRRRPAARRFAIVAAGIAAVMTLCVGAIFLFADGPFEVRVFSSVVGHATAWTAIVVLVPLLLIHVWIVYALTRPSARSEFGAVAATVSDARGSKNGGNSVPA